MTNIVKEEKLTAPVVLAVIAGSLMLIGGMVTLGMMIGYHTMYGGHTMLGMMMYNGLQSVMPAISSWVVWVSIGAMVCGGLVLYSSYMLHINPQRARTYGLIIAIISGIAFFVGHGFWLGSILGLIAGLWAMSQK